MTNQKERRPQAGPQPPIPEFRTREEEAEFWDNHDLADYWDQFKPATVRVAKNLSQGITIRFDAETLAGLRAQARELGIGPTTLVRMWVLERLRGERNRSTTLKKEPQP